MKKRTLSGVGLSWVIVMALSSARVAHAIPAGTVPSFDKVMIVIFENEDASTVDGQPFFASLGKTGSILGNMNAEAHPSQPNYIALTSGGEQGVTSDSNKDVSAQNIADLIEAKGKTWKAYVEAWPGNCFTGATSTTYARKHNPFISYVNIQKNAARCANIVNSTVLDQDIAAGTLPDYAFYVPDMNNDGHDTSAAYADKWFSGRFGPILANPLFAKETVIATFDESLLLGGNVIYTAFVGNHVAPGSVSTARYDHYSMLKTIEVGLGLGSLGASDASATPITGIWQ